MTPGAPPTEPAERPGVSAPGPQPLPPSETLATLLHAAHGVRQRAYAPYSGFSVGAALLDEDGAIHVGANFENASFPVGTCAERTALGAAISAGRRAFRAIAIVADAPQPVMPCGMCRQALYEFAPDLVVILENLQGVREVRTLSQLLPDGVRAGSLPTLRGGAAPRAQPSTPSQAEPGPESEPGRAEPGPESEPGQAEPGPESEPGRPSRANPPTPTP